MAPKSDLGPPRPKVEDPFPRDGGRAAVVALAAVESRRLIFHPVVVGSVLLTGLFVITSAWNPDDDFLSYKFAVGGSLLLYATGVMVAASLAASRSRRSGTDELFTTMPVQPLTRTAALIAALGPAVAVAAIAQTVFIVAVGARDGLGAPAVPSTEVSVQTVVVTPGAAALLQGPVLVALGGAFGIALARWISSVFPVYFVMGLTNFVVWPALLWWEWGWQRFLLPLAHDLRTSGSVDLGGGRSALRVLDRHRKRSPGTSPIWPAGPLCWPGQRSFVRRAVEERPSSRWAA